MWGTPAWADWTVIQWHDAQQDSHPVGGGHSPPLGRARRAIRSTWAGLVIVFDTGALIAYLDADHPDHERAMALVDELAEEDWAVTPLTISALLAEPATADDRWLHIAIRVLDGLGVEEMPLPHPAGVQLAQLRATTGLPDEECSVILLAQTHEAGLATLDPLLADAARAAGLTVWG